MTFEESFKKYLEAASSAGTHQAKMIAFTIFLSEVFGKSSYEIIQDVEKYVSTRDKISMMTIKGRMDMHFGQTIIEFKLNLSRELEAAKEELARYAKIMRSNRQKVGECIVTDGLIFKVMVVGDEAKEVREIDFRKVPPETAILFLDTYLFSARKKPTAEDLAMRFGPGSPVYEEVVGGLTPLFGNMQIPIKFQLWQRNMQIVYGNAPPDEAFVSQTYLMVLVRLLLLRYLTGRAPPLLDGLNGKIFQEQGIHIIEEDFFSWIFDQRCWPQIEPLVNTMVDALECYDLSEIDEDVFKEIYQEIIKRGERHRIGEYYTPEWLAELTLNEAIKAIGQEKKFTVLDPACGSGTFLTKAVIHLKRNGASLKEVLESVYGIDLNPLAIEISRTNYLLALGRLIEKRKGPIFIPVFMADSIKLPDVRREVMYGEPILAIDVDEKLQLNLPLEVALDDNKLKEDLKLFEDILREYRTGRLSKPLALKAFESMCGHREALKEILKETLQKIMDLIDVDKDSIWVFMMRNIYAPLRMKEKKFDLVVGNPPWVSFKFIENVEYQKFIKKTVFEYGLLSPKQTDLFTQIDTSTAFYTKVADIYLKDSGILAFVMPKSVLTGAKQHEAFKKQLHPPMRVLGIHDVGEVKPLFNVKACIIIAQKGGATTFPVPAGIWSGELSKKNALLKDAKKVLELRESKYVPPKKSDKTSPYHGEMLSGAGIYPRTLWFVKFVPSSFGVNLEEPLVESLILPDAKAPWKSVMLKGSVEKDFVFATMTGKDLLPFKPQFKAVVLPIEKGSYKYKILTPEELRGKGKLKMANWVETANKYWSSLATKTSIANFPTPMDYMNYHNKLELQRTNLRYYVVYTASGTHIAAAVVDTKNLPPFQVDGAKIRPNGFVADYKTFWFGTNNANEASYLVAILNSNVMDEMIKPHQSEGAFGARDICRLPFEFNIPEYDPNNGIHTALAVLGAEAAKEADRLPRASRMKIKAKIPQMQMIDELTKKLLMQNRSDVLRRQELTDKRSNDC